MLTNGGAATCETDMTADVKKLVLVFDVGGSHVSAAICLGNGFQLSSVTSAPYPPEHTSDAFVDFLYALGAKASAGFEGVSGAELAIPGPFDFKNGVSLMRHKLPYIYGVDLRRLLAARFGWQPSQVRFLLDSAAFLLGEIAAGAAHGVSRAVGITLGTGVGSAFAVNGSLVTEGPGVPPGGEIWNLPYEGGIVEDFVSTRAIQKNYQSRTGELAEVAKIAARASSDPAAIAVFAEFGRHFGLALRMILPEFAPQVVVLGGGISRSAHLFLPATQEQLANPNLRLLPSALKDAAPLVGAAAAWFSASSDDRNSSAPAIAFKDLL
jgi:glucokinase